MTVKIVKILVATVALGALVLGTDPSMARGGGGGRGGGGHGGGGGHWGGGGHFSGGHRGFSGARKGAHRFGGTHIRSAHVRGLSTHGRNFAHSNRIAHSGLAHAGKLGAAGALGGHAAWNHWGNRWNAGWNGGWGGWGGWWGGSVFWPFFYGDLLAFVLPDVLDVNVRHSHAASSRSIRSRAFCGFVLGGACTTTSFYAFMAASPFILVNLLYQPAERVGLYYLLLMAGVAAGSLSANRLAGKIRTPNALRIANSIAIVGSACFMLAYLVGWLNVVSVIAPVVLFMVGAGMASPFALSGAVSVNPHAIGAASGLYGFTQMAYGALCTVIVEAWHPGSVFTVAAVLLASALLGQAALSLAVRRASA